MFPQHLLMSNPSTNGWHTLGMEWKEHIAWLVHISITMVAFIFIKYGRDLKNHPRLRTAVLCCVALILLGLSLLMTFPPIVDLF